MKRAIVVGAGPAGLMAAEQLADRGLAVDVYEQMPTAGRKLLRAGIGGLNITHSEPQASFIQRYSRGSDWLAPQLAAFGAAELIAFFHALGIDTFVGTSGRVFPIEKKAAPFLRRWLSRLREKNVQFHFRHRLCELGANRALFTTADTVRAVAFDVCVLALGGGSWCELGSDGRWQSLLGKLDVDLKPFEPSNMGFMVRAQGRDAWSAPLQAHAGKPLKHIQFNWQGKPSAVGECVLTERGLEGGLIYACSSDWREAIKQAPLAVSLDLQPHRSQQQLQSKLAKPRGKQSLSKFLRQQLNLDEVKLALLYEAAPKAATLSADELAALLKALPLEVLAASNPERAISTAGGVALSALSASSQLNVLPSIFCCGEMLDWDAPTGGYLLTACFANGRAAGQAAADYLLGSSAKE